MTDLASSDIPPAPRPTFDVLTLREAADACRMSIASIHRHIAAGRITTVKIVGRRLILRDDLEAFLKAHRA